MTIKENVILAPYTTFKIGGPARYFSIVKNEEDVVEAVNFALENKASYFIIGSGSNLLVSDSGFNGLVIKNEIMGKEFISENDRNVLIYAGAGEDWETLVKESVEKGLYGIENLSAIPGTVGASPIQNIGAYGVDVSSVIVKVRAFDTKTMQFVEMKKDECSFSYRDSIFKHEKGRYIVTKVTYRLFKDGIVNFDYKDLKEYFLSKNISSPTLTEVRNAVIEIRKNKLPDWKVCGTAGSFFKNPIISKEQFDELKKKYPGLPGYAESDGRIKVSLAWILDKVCDAKGLTIGNAATYERQALVIVAKPGAKAAEIVELAEELIRRVKEKTGLIIEGEVEWAVA